MHHTATRPFISTLLLATALSLGSCALTQAPTKMSSSARVLEVPFVQQEETYACGAVAAQSLCSFWSAPFDAATQASLEKAAEQHQGLSGAELRAQLEVLGFETFLFHGTLDHAATGVLRHVDAGRPPLLMLKPKSDHGHYVLLVGYDEELHNVCLLDPVRGSVLESYESFEQSWARSEHFTLLAIPRNAETVPDTKAE
jgi:ABC-type bacteriocin/lantibiotic exporter with double-glycine peptidase domain